VPLTSAESELLAACLAAHDQSARRPTPSLVAVLNAFFGSRNYANAIASACTALGTVHGPIVETYDLIVDPRGAALAGDILDRGRKVPGWGSSFAKGGIDPIWDPVDSRLRALAPSAMRMVDGITRLLSNHGKDLWPNPSTYTAATAIALGIRRELAPWLFIHGRLAAWSQAILLEGGLWAQQQ
jgi:citrate synthase